MKQILLRLSFFLVLLLPVSAFAQETVIAGKVVNSQTKEPMIGVNIGIKGTVTGTISNGSGSFQLGTRSALPLKLVISFVGFTTQEIDITAATADLNIELQEQTIMTDEVVVSASRVEESVLQSPVTVEKLDLRAIRETPSANFYDALNNIKGVDMNTQSLTFKSVTTRGFGANGQTRVVQIIDGMDNQAPGLNFAVGNIVGICELDLEGVELLPGAASALYGPNALNGIILMNSKSPFKYQGLSATAKTGLMHVAEDGKKQTPFYDASIRFAHAFNNKFAFKLNLSYLTADDWQAKDTRDQSFLNGYNLSTGNRQNNQAYNGVNVFGDEPLFTSNIYSSLYGNGTPGNGTGGTSAILGLIATQQFAQVGNKTLPQITGLTPQQIFGQIIPNQVIGRDGYAEQSLVDYTTKSFKLNGSAHYRINDKIEAILQANYGTGTTVYTGNDRYSLRNFKLGQYKIELKGSNFNLRAYTTQERSGDSYIGGAVGQLINESWSPSASTWFPTYFGTFAQGSFQTYATALLTALGGGQSQQAAITAAQTATSGAYSSLYDQARAAADKNRLLPGTEAFNTVADAAKNTTIDKGGAKFLDKTNLYHYEGMYNFSEQIKFAEIIVGANYRTYQLKSEGTLFGTQDFTPTGKEYSINEWGAYIQASKKFFDDHFKLTGSIRHDKNQNFEGVNSPRLSGVFTFLENHNIRLSYQTGFRIPTTQDQYIDLKTSQAHLVGGLPVFADYYKLNNTANPYYTAESVSAYGASVLAGKADQALLKAYTFPELKPEKVKTYEIGYKSLIANKLFIDAYFYYSEFSNFLLGQAILQEKTPTAAKAGLLTGQTRNTFQLQATNRSEVIKSQGWAIGLNYALPAKFTLGANVAYNKLLNEDDLKSFQVGYNTPLYRFNVTFANREVVKNVGFSLAYRYQDRFLWQSSFVNTSAIADSYVPSFGLFDAQVSYKVSQIKSIIKVGGSNLFNKYYTTAWGNPSVGGMYYISITFDQLMNK